MTSRLSRARNRVAQSISSQKSSDGSLRSKANILTSTLNSSAKYLLITVLCLGFFFRFANLSQKVYWVDEVATAVRISGFTLQEMTDNLVDGPELNIAQIQKYQYPNHEKTVTDTVNSLVVEDSQHPPLFFVLLRSWVTLFGNSLSSLRSLSALFSLLILPAVFWLCRELFQSPLVGWIAIALMSVSPVQVSYAQEARQYSLWTLLIILSSAMLMRALRLSRHLETKASNNHSQSRISWLTYGLLVVLGLYTHLLFALIAVGHGLYVLVLEKFRFTPRLRNLYLQISSHRIGLYALVSYPLQGLFQPRSRH